MQRILWQSAEGKIWHGGNDVTVLPDEAVKSFLETKSPREILEGACGGPQLLLNRLVLSTPPLQLDPSLSSALLHYIRAGKGAKKLGEPRSHSKQLGSKPTVVQACRSPAVPLLCSAHCFDFSLSSDGTVEDFTRLDGSLSGTL